MQHVVRHEMGIQAVMYMSLQYLAESTQDLCQPIIALVFSRPILVYRGNFRKFPQRWKFSTHNAFVNECCDGHCEGRRSCFQQSSTDFVGSCEFVRTEGHECSVHRVLFDFWYRE